MNVRPPLLTDDGPSPFGYLQDGESKREHLSWSFEMDAVSREDASFVFG